MRLSIRSSLALIALLGGLLVVPTLAFAQQSTQLSSTLVKPQPCLSCPKPGSQVPEPAAALLFAAGATVVAYGVKRRRNQG